MAFLGPRLLSAAGLAARVAARVPAAARRRALSLSPRAHFKIFREQENGYAYDVLRGREELHKTMANVDAAAAPPQVEPERFDAAVGADWSGADVEEVIAAFEVASSFGARNELRIEDDRFENICTALKNKCKSMTDDQLFRVIRCLCLWGPSAESLSSKNFNLWTSVDVECLDRAKHWSKSMLLLAADHWYNLNIVRSSKFMYFCTRKLSRKPSALSPQELVQTLFYLNVFRKHSSITSMFEYEYCFEKLIDSMDINDIAIFAMAFFKTESKIHTESLTSKIIARIIESASTVDSIPLTAILKSLRLSLRRHFGYQLYGLLNELCKEVPRLSLLTCVHMALLGTITQVFHEDTIKAVCERFVKEMESLRAKDLERIALVLHLYDYDPQTKPCIYEKIEQELRSSARLEEFKRYHKTFPRCVSYLSQRNIYLLDLISQVLEPAYIEAMYGKRGDNVDLEVLALDVGVEIERPDYTGPRLNEKTKKGIFKRHVRYMLPPKNNSPVGQKIIYEVFGTAVAIAGGENFVCAAHVLPQYPLPDILFRVSAATGAFTEVGSVTAEVAPGCVVRPPTEGGDQWCCLMPVTVSDFVRESNRPIGPTVTHLRLLKALGYSVAMVPWFEWMGLSPERRQPYLADVMRKLAQRP